VVAFSKDDKEWLDEEARRQRVPMTELVRRAVRAWRSQQEAASTPTLQHAELRQQLRLKLPDALQAAVAVEHNLTLVTRNTKDFKPGMGTLEVLVPYRI
jgi:predicted nucleic acid-binding protein